MRDYTVHGDAAFHGVAMAHEDQSFRIPISRKPSACKELQPSWIQYMFLKNVEKSNNHVNISLNFCFEESEQDQDKTDTHTHVDRYLLVFDRVGFSGLQKEENQLRRKIWYL